MKEQEEAERIIEMFGDKAELHVQGVIKELNSVNENTYFVSEKITCKFLYWQQVLEIIKNK